MLEEEREELVHALNRDLLAEEALDPIFEVVRIRDAQILHDLPQLRQMDLHQDF